MFYACFRAGLSHTLSAIEHGRFKVISLTHNIQLLQFFFSSDEHIHDLLDVQEEKKDTG